MQTLELAQQTSQESKIQQELGDVMNTAVKDGVFPGAVLVVGVGDETLYFQAHGSKSFRTNRNPEPLTMTEDTVFDLAGLTASVATATIIMKLVELDRITLPERMSRYIQGFGVLGKSPITLSHLLTHTSGLPAWIPYFEEILRENTSSRVGILTSRGARDYVLSQIIRSPLKAEQGVRYLYSDVGLILLGELVEALTALSLERAFHKFVAQPLRLKSSSYIDLTRIRRGGITPVTDLIAPTEDCSWRKRVLCGEVHDDNAWAMGGIAGHSGIFSSAPDLDKYCRELRLALAGKSDFLRRETVVEFTQPRVLANGTIVRHGWDTASRENGMVNAGLSQSAFGCNGFTGCSLWIDPERDMHIILLSNRINPTRSNKKLLAFRPQVHKTVVDLLDEARGEQKTAQEISQ
jgi:serine-type D-Ala-D-Ala carboxypeptidase